MPAVVASHPQRTEQMFQALKKHIMRQRQKKKEEQEADAEVERQRKERELQQKQDVMTLGENREQIAQLERVLAQLKDEKHQLFLQLKKVLNEDDNRRRQHVRQQESRVSSAEVPMDLYSGLTYPNVPAMSGHLSHLVMQPNYPNTLYKVPTTHTLLLPAASLKRPRSPSPPPQVPYHHSSYNQKHPSPRLSYQKSSGYSGYYPSSASSSSSQSSSYPSYPSSFSGVSSRNEAPPPSEQTPSAPQPSKHSIYLSQPIPRGTITQPYMHSALEHPKMSYSDDKFYSVSSLRPATHVALHGGAIPIQQPAQGSKTGGITSGYPIRPPSSAPPQHVTPGTTHGSSSPGVISSSGYHFPMSSQFPTRSTTSAPTQLLASRSHGVYVSQSPSSGRLVYSQASVPQSRYLQRD